MENRKYLPEIWVYCETNEKGLTRGSQELLGKARSLADEMDCMVTAVLFELAGRKSGAQAAICFGADIAYHFLSSCGMDEAAQAQAIEEKLNEE